MEYSKVNQELKYLATNGVTLNPDEKLNISLALQQLHCELNFEELMLWGKINGKFHFFILKRRICSLVFVFSNWSLTYWLIGVLTDYYIALGVNYLGRSADNLN